MSTKQHWDYVAIIFWPSSNSKFRRNVFLGFLGVVQLPSGLTLIRRKIKDKQAHAFIICSLKCRLWKRDYTCKSHIKLLYSFLHSNTHKSILISWKQNPKYFITCAGESNWLRGVFFLSPAHVGGNDQGIKKTSKCKQRSLGLLCTRMQTNRRFFPLYPEVVDRQSRQVGPPLSHRNTRIKSHLHK